MTSAFVTSAIEPGGAERWVLDATKVLSRNGRSAIVIANNGTPTARFFQSHGLDVIEFPFGLPIGDRRYLGALNEAFSALQAASPVRRVAFERLVARLVNDRGVRHVNVQSLKEAIWMGSLAHREVRVSTTLHAPVDAYPALTHERVREPYVRLLLRCHTLFAVCETTRDSYASAFGLNIGRFVVAYNPAPAWSDAELETARLEYRSLFGLGDADVAIGTVCRLVPQKGIDHVLECARSMLNKHPNARFLVVGGGKREALYRKLADRMGLKNVSFLGYRSDASRLMAAFDAFLLLSEYEGFPYVLLEAASAGLPIISTSVGGIPEMARKLPGITLVKWTDIPSALAALDGIVQDRNERARLGNLNREAAARDFSFDRFASAVYPHLTDNCLPSADRR